MPTLNIRPCPQDEIAANPCQVPLRTALTPTQCMDMAYALALKGAGYVRTNPLVGAVLVDAEHRFLGGGAHLRFGEGHAEANLFADIERLGLKEATKGGTLYVTLEPCCHFGKTPPCADLVKRFPIAKVVCAEIDPNPQVQGKGIGSLKAAGIAVEISQEFAQRCQGLLDPFRWYVERHTPFVGMKVASSLDGMIGPTGAQRIWITNERARHYGHWLRLLYDAILVGADTMIQDQPTLNIRNPLFPSARTPVRIVLDPHGRALAKTPTFGAPTSSWLWCVKEGTHTGGLEWCLTLPWEAGKGFVLPALLKELGQRGISSLLLEGGRQVWGSFLAQGLVQRLHLVQAPVLLGAEGMMPWPQAVKLAQPQELASVSLTGLGDNWLIEGNIKQ